VNHPRHLGELRDRIRAGWQPEFGFFLEPDPTERDLGNECLSQWYRAPMRIDGVQFPTAEHYMMWRKARLFDDSAMEQRILADDDPGIAKQLGRKVRGFNAEIWHRHRLDIVLQGSVAKFEQHRILREYLLNTGDRVLAEASPVDNIWGIGFAVDDPRSKNPLLWTGLNLLGFALMSVREHFIQAEHVGARPLNCTFGDTLAVARRIAGFHMDDAGDWVAQLECGHNQHVRHNPPWASRPWVVSPEGRAAMIGEMLQCPKCSAGAPPDPRST